jgi:hypothetical protein
MYALFSVISIYGMRRLEGEGKQREIAWYFKNGSTFSTYLRKASYDIMNIFIKKDSRFYPVFKRYNSA